MRKNFRGGKRYMERRSHDFNSQVFTSLQQLWSGKSCHWLLSKRLQSLFGSSAHGKNLHPPSWPPTLLKSLGFYNKINVSQTSKCNCFWRETGLCYKFTLQIISSARMLKLIIIHDKFNLPSPSLLLAPFTSLQKQEKPCYNTLVNGRLWCHYKKTDMRHGQVPIGPKQRNIRPKLMA